MVNNVVAVLEILKRGHYFRGGATPPPENNSALISIDTKKRIN